MFFDPGSNLGLISKASGVSGENSIFETYDLQAVRLAVKMNRLQPLRAV
jgi:hypothetical protein